MQFTSEVRLRQTLQGSGVLQPRSYTHLLQRDGGGSGELHLEELQEPSLLGAPAEACQLPKHHHHLPKERQEHLPHHAQLQSHGLPPLVHLYGAAAVQRGQQPLHHLHRGPVEPGRQRKRILLVLVSVPTFSFSSWELGKAHTEREVPGAPTLKHFP